MSDREHAQLNLRGYDLPSVENNLGVANGSNSNYLWKIINLRTLLGPIYDKYDSFNLTLKYIASSSNIFTLPANDANVFLNITGLPFLNNTYQQSHFCNTSVAVLGTYNFPLVIGQTSNTCFYSSNYITFGKNQELVNINIFYNKILDGSISSQFPGAVFILDIFGIDKEVNNINGTRMNIASSR